jgi:hypothetical protein
MLHNYLMSFDFILHVEELYADMPCFLLVLFNHRHYGRWYPSSRKDMAWAPCNVLVKRDSVPIENKAYRDKVLLYVG